MKKYLLLGYLLLYGLLFFNSDWNKIYDSPRYICLAYSISQGNGYRFIFDSENKPCFYNNFVLPYLLSPLVKLFGINFPLLKGFILSLSLLCLLLFYHWAKLYFRERECFYLSILLLSSSIFIEFSDKILTEIPFSLLLLLCFYLFEIWLKNKNNFTLTLLSLSLYLAIFTRIIGIAILFSFMFYGLVRKEKKILFAGLLVFIMIIITIFFIQLNVSPEDKFYHLKYFLFKNQFIPEEGFIDISDLSMRLLQNLKFYLINSGKITVDFPLKPFWASILSLLFILVGLVTNRLRHKLFYFPFIILYILYLLSWPWQDIRFLMPLSFLFLFYFYSGIRYLTRNKSLYLKSLSYGLVLTFSIYGGIDKLISKITIENVQPPELKEFIQLTKWTKDNLEESSIILSSEPALVYLLSLKKGAFLIYTSNSDRINSYLKRKRVTHILADRYNAEMKRYFYPWIKKNKNRLKILKIEGETILFKLN